MAQRVRTRAASQSNPRQPPMGLNRYRRMRDAWEAGVRQLQWWAICLRSAE